MFAICTLEATRSRSSRFEPLGLVRFQSIKIFETRLKLHLKDLGSTHYLFSLHDHGDLLDSDDQTIASFSIDTDIGSTTLFDQIVQVPIQEFVGRKISISDSNGHMIAHGVVAHSPRVDLDFAPMTLEWRSCSRQIVYR